MLLADHPGATPHLVGIAAFGHIERDFLDRGAGVGQALRSGTANRIDLALDADAGDIGHVGDPQAPRVARAGDNLARAAPWRRDRDRGQSAQPHHRV